MSHELAIWDIEGIQYPAFFTYIRTVSAVLLSLFGKTQGSNIDPRLLILSTKNYGAFGSELIIIEMSYCQSPFSILA